MIALPFLLALTVFLVLFICIVALIYPNYHAKAINDNSSVTSTTNTNNNTGTLKGFDTLSPAVGEALAAEDSHILYSEFILKVMNNVRAHPENTTLQQEYKLIQNDLDFEYGDFPTLCNVGDRNAFDRSMSDVCNAKISFIYPTCLADPSINKEACDPNNALINNYLKHFNPSILKNTSSKDAYVILNSALTVPPPPTK